MVAEYPTLYPNVFLGLQADHYWTRFVQPVSAERSLDHLQIYYLGDAADDPDFNAARAHRLEVWAKVFNEDIGVVEGMQRGRQLERLQRRRIHADHGQAIAPLCKMGRETIDPGK